MTVGVLASMFLLFGSGLIGVLASGDFKHSKPRRALLLSGVIAVVGIVTGVVLLVFC